MGNRLFTSCTIGLLLAGCVGGAGDGSEDGAAASTQRLVERDVEAPEVFQITDTGVWDGRPSLGGVWVAHPSTDEPERVIIRNEANGQFVIGALFRRDADLPGPALQVSSDAADALQMQAGTPARLDVTALRREDAAADATATPAPSIAPDEAQTEPGLGAAHAIDTQPLDAAAPATLPVPAPAPVSAPSAAGSVSKPFIQIGIFGEEQNAENTAAALRGAGLTPAIEQQRTAGKTLYRVTVGPAARAADLETVKRLGFPDAYFVSG